MFIMSATTLQRSTRRLVSAFAAFSRVYRGALHCYGTGEQSRARDARERGRGRGDADQVMDSQSVCEARIFSITTSE